ncbi:hypothetical protein BST14_28670, partial [Mycobacterium arosiense ATCC BAA-1401 = DSM 45069]
MRATLIAYLKSCRRNLRDFQARTRRVEVIGRGCFPFHRRRHGHGRAWGGGWVFRCRSGRSGSEPRSATG